MIGSQYKKGGLKDWSKIELKALFHLLQKPGVNYPPPKKIFLGGIVESGLRVRSSVRPSVRPSVRDDISQTTEHFVLKNYPSICYLCAMRSAKFRKIRVQNTRLYPRAVFRDLCIYSKSHMSAGSAAQIFNFFKSVPYLRAMCSPKFRTILIQNGRLRAIFTSKWSKFCPSGPISHKPLNILFWNITHLFVTSVPCVPPSFGKL